ANMVTFVALIAVTCRSLARVEARRRAGDRRLAAQYATTRILAESGSIEEAMPQILATVGGSLRWIVGMRWSVDAEGQVLRCAEAWIAPSFHLSEFVEATRRLSFPCGQGLPGRVWSAGKAAWIADVTIDPNFPRAPVAARKGLHGAFGFPIIGPSGFLGVMEF